MALQDFTTRNKIAEVCQGYLIMSINSYCLYLGLFVCVCTTKQQHGKKNLTYLLGGSE